MPDQETEPIAGDGPIPRPAVDLKPRSRDVTDGLEAAAARGMLRAVGMRDEDFAKPQIGVVSTWNEITPCNLGLSRLAQAVKNGVHAAGGYPLEFGTISVSGRVVPPRPPATAAAAPSPAGPGRRSWRCFALASPPGRC